MNQLAVCQVANVNSPTQIVISGTKSIVERACGIAKEKFTARRIIPLTVSAPFHSKVLSGAQLSFNEQLERLTRLSGEKVSLIRNCDASLIREWDYTERLSNPVLFSKSIMKAIQVDDRPCHFIEIGGSVLGPLIKACVIGAHHKVDSLTTLDDIEKFHYL